jgi:DnaJ-class molecular chaperone
MILTVLSGVQVNDPSCVARGKAWKTPCPACPNGMTEEEEIQLTVDVQAGMRHGDTVKFDQVADEAVGHIPGDLVFVINQQPHAVFRRENDDLYAEVMVTLLESLVGFSKTLDHLDGHKVTIAKDDVTFCSETIVIANEGMPIKGGRGERGNLFVTLNIDFPTHFTAQQKNLIRQAMSS